MCAQKRHVLVLNSYPDPPPPFRNPVSAPGCGDMRFSGALDTIQNVYIMHPSQGSCGENTDWPHTTQRRNINFSNSPTETQHCVIETLDRMAA